ncbi:hypothetical protein M408DRAFT_246582 [Serendipita vermifera MAFF 305830]|uniref:Uncharacterized protein n=1 Tax=Serendipita vermifera MAFF 305830 TaxID=933852 RepID=A0A0C2X3H0_SERVB|nr:hypothetical protein M408DRAFT_246582 [Serendipita vermifera MAFF 305830]
MTNTVKKGYSLTTRVKTQGQRKHKRRGVRRFVPGVDLLLESKYRRGTEVLGDSQRGETLLRCCC